MKLAAIPVLALLALAAPLAAQDAQAPAATEARPEKITDKDHPDYVKCRKEPVIGSHAKKRRVCLTNRQWAEVANDGNRVAERMVEDGRAGMNGSN